MIQEANSGHPGLPLGAAPMAYVLWSRHLKVNPKTSRKYENRDRFVLSAGHGSALLYSLLHLSGHQLSMEDLKGFRKFGSLTPGHPEVDHTDGVEATTGPLGQGIANAVGMAMAEAHLAAQFNKSTYPIVDHHTYALCGDGDLMEGVSAEAASLAGHLKLGKLVILYDSNDISLDGALDQSMTEDVQKRFEAYGWHYIKVNDGNNLEEIDQAIIDAKAEETKPTLIEVKTVIGFGAEKQGTSAVHGAPLGVDGVAKAKENLGVTYPSFTVPEEITEHFRSNMYRGEESEKDWNELFKEYKYDYANEAKAYEEAMNGTLPVDFEKNLPVYEVGESAASRVTSQENIQALEEMISNLWGGSADLAASNNTRMKAADDFQYGNYQGKNIWFGVREFAMGAIMNGIALHGGTRVYGGTFFVFSNYLLPAMRMAAIQNLPVTYVYTHDSIAVGEDGPTHEPIEQLAMLRSMPNMNVIRPADGNEVSAAWALAMKSKTVPTSLVLSRQNLPVLEGTKERAMEGVARGGYVLSASENEVADGLIIATGSEVALAVSAQQELRNKGVDVSVVSMPSTDLFEQQSDEYKESVLPKAVTKRLVIEAASSFGWERYAKDEGQILTIDQFGLSGDGTQIFGHFGFTNENVVAIVENMVKETVSV
jgi:transketolase